MGITSSPGRELEEPTSTTQRSANGCGRSTSQAAVPSGTTVVARLRWSCDSSGARMSRSLARHENALTQASLDDGDIL